MEQKYEEEEEPVRSSPCQDKDKFKCIEENEENGLRRCRYNYKLNSCEDSSYQGGEIQRLVPERLAPLENAFYL